MSDTTDTASTPRRARAAAPAGPVTFEELAALMKGRAGLTVDAREMESNPAITFEELNLDSLGLLGIVAELDAPLNADRRPVKSARQVALLGKQLG